MTKLSLLIKRILFLLLVISNLAGQTDTRSPQSISNLPEFLREDSIHVFLADSIILQNKKPMSHRTHLIRKAGIGIFLLSGFITIHYQGEAQDTYNQYLRTGDPNKMDSLLNRTAQLDKISGWSYVGLETGILLIIYSFYE
ncbi:MAG: hypothetical protein U9N31_05615 [Candidatus Marinimicrobia bacterium]|nr:hypothetical protein [Candidatus Neomarinimicrobiota bacterium]